MKTTLTLAITHAEKENALVDFLFSVYTYNLLVIHDEAADIHDSILRIHAKMNTPCKVIINTGRRTTIVRPTYPDDNVKVIYCRNAIDIFTKALIREYNMPIVLFND